MKTGIQTGMSLCVPNLHDVYNFHLSEQPDGLEVNEMKTLKSKYLT